MESVEALTKRIAEALIKSLQFPIGERRAPELTGYELVSAAMRDVPDLNWHLVRVRQFSDLDPTVPGYANLDVLILIKTEDGVDHAQFTGLTPRGIRFVTDLARMRRHG